MEKMKKFFQNETSELENKVNYFDAKNVFADGDEDNDYADGQVEPSQPLIFTITNSASTAKSDVVLFNANNNNPTSFTDPYTLETDVTISYDLPNLTYAQFINQLKSIPYEIGKIMVLSSDASTLFSPIGIETYNMLGEKFSKVITLERSSFQNQSDQIEKMVRFTLNAMTKMFISYIGAGKSATYYLYPVKVGSTKAPLKDGRTFEKPQLSGMAISTKIPVTKIS